MFITAIITDKAIAPRIRRQLHKLGFSYNPIFREWVCNPMGLRGARLTLEKTRSITGAEFTLVPADEHIARIEADVAKRAA